jgi:predicted MFS family arabinose efflux permease
MIGGVLHTVLLSLYAFPAFSHADASLVAILVVIEHFTGGIATVALFTAMMDVCDPKTGGTEYTVQASAVVFVQFLGSVLSGISAQSLGYGWHFVLVGAVSAVGVIAMALGFSRQPRFLP